MNQTEKNSVYEKLTPQRKQLVDLILANLEKGAGLWEMRWFTGAPEKAMSEKKYRGINNFFLTLIALSRGYKDNRWFTFHQMSERDWHFKTDEEGNSLGKGAGVSVEFFELRDRETKKPFDRSVLDGMTAEEKEEYINNNVYPIRKYYTVFNGDLIEGVPEKKQQVFEESEQVKRAEHILDYWDKEECKIIYGGDQAVYIPLKDEIHCPLRNSFFDLQEFYATVLHEIGHSTGHEKRLNRPHGTDTQSYATEELRAEIASMFMEQDLGIAVEEKHIRNNSAYIEHWKNKINENPNVLFEAIADADKIAKYVIHKAEEKTKRTKAFAIQQTINSYGEILYRAYTLADNLEELAVMYPKDFESREELLEELEKTKKLPQWENIRFVEVGYEKLSEMAEKVSELPWWETAHLEEVEEKPSEIYVKPSVILNMPAPAVPVHMTDRGIESLTIMADRDVVERAQKTKNGDKFMKLYNGESVLGNKRKDERSLMVRLAMFTGNNQEQLLRIFKSSGQYNEETPSLIYEKMAEQAIQFIDKQKAGTPLLIHQTEPKHYVANTKS